MKKPSGILRWLFLPIVGGLLSGCVQMPKVETFFQLTPESAQHRALPDVGMLRAAKERGAREYGQEIMQFIVVVLGAIGGKAVIMPVDVHQQISATLVTRRSETDASRFSVRILFHRSVWKGDGNTGDQHIPPGQQSLEIIKDGKIYQQFFAKLSKGVFLEAHKI
jgi:hypothetical protein